MRRDCPRIVHVEKTQKRPLKRHKLGSALRFCELNRVLPRLGSPSQAVVSLPHHRDTVVFPLTCESQTGQRLFSTRDPKAKTPLGEAVFWNALCRTRTYDPLIKSQLLCQLS